MKRHLGQSSGWLWPCGLAYGQVELVESVTKERGFFEALRGVFVGAEAEGESGHVNLRRVKLRYYERGMFRKLHA